jgi:hypothetical protein
VDLDEVSVYRTIRSIHLCAGLFAMPFLVAYAISAVQMTHGKWLHMQPRVSNREVMLPPRLSDARVAARELAHRYGVSGELTAIRAVQGNLGFRILRPGMVWEAAYHAPDGATKLRITDTGLLGAFNRIHQMRGVWHEWSAYNLWAVVLAGIGLAILTLGATGVYLWWKSNRDRRLSGAVLAFAIVAVAGVAAWMRMG